MVDMLDQEVALTGYRDWDWRPGLVVSNSDIFRRTVVMIALRSKVSRISRSDFGMS